MSIVETFKSKQEFINFDNNLRGKEALGEGVSRRDFVKGLVGGLIVGGVVAGIAGYAGGKGAAKTITTTVTQTGAGAPAATATVTKTVTSTVTQTVTAGKTPAGIPKTPIKLGVVTILSGPGAMLFDPGLKTLQMEIEKINAQGGILGRKVELIVYDSGGKPDRCVDLYKKLVTEDQVDFVTVGATSAEACAVGPIAEQMKVVTLIQEGTANKLFEEVIPNPRYVFRIANYDAIDAISHARAILKTFPNVKRIAGIIADYVWGHDEWEILTTTLKKMKPDIEIVAEAYPPLFSKDFSSHISKVLSANPDYVDLVLWGGDLVTCIKQGMGYGLFSKAKVGAVTGGEYVWGLGTDAPEGMLCSTRYYFLYPPWDKWWINRDFNKEFHERYPDVRGGYPGFNCNSCYVVAHALKLAIEKAYAITGEWPSQEDVARALENLMVPSPGGYRYFRKEDHQMLGYSVSGLTKLSPDYPFVILDPVWANPPEEVAPPPGVKWREWVESW